MARAPSGLSGLFSGIVKSRRMKHAARFIREGDRVLDLGCGLGEMIPLLPESAEYLGVDNSVYMIERNRSRYENRAFACLDFEKDILPEGPWDVILLLAVLEHLRHPGKMFSSFGNLLKSGGKVILTTPHPKSARLHAWMARLRLLSPVADSEHVALYDRPALEEMACGADLVFRAYHTFLFSLNQLVVMEKSR